MWLFSLDNLRLLLMVLSIHAGYLLSNTILFYVLKLVDRAGFSYRVFIYWGLPDSPLLPDSVSSLPSLLKPFHCQRSRLHFHTIFALYISALKAPSPLSWAPFWFPESLCSLVCFNVADTRLWHANEGLPAPLHVSSLLCLSPHLLMCTWLSRATDFCECCNTPHARLCHASCLLFLPFFGSNRYKLIGRIRPAL